jgi:Tol biopolymer transport system component/fibronectin type 3 domain-containing protein
LLEERTLPTIQAVSLATPSLIPDTGSGDSQLTQTIAPSQSADGRYTVFSSTAQNLTPNQTHKLGEGNVFLYDRVTGTTTLISHQFGDPTAIGDGGSNSPTISADGRFVVYVSSASNLVSGQTEPTTRPVGQDIFLFDRLTGLNNLVSHTAGAAATSSDGGSLNPVISADGSYVAFMSESTDLVPGQVSKLLDDNVFLYNVATGATTLVSHASDSATNAANGGSNNSTSPALSAEGRFLVYSTQATNLVAGQVDTGQNGSDVFLYDRTTNSSTLVSHTAASGLAVGNGAAFSATISADGASVAFVSNASDIVANEVPPASMGDVFLYNAATGTNTLVSHVSGAALVAAGGSSLALISADGSTIAFISSAANIVPGQTGPVTPSLFLYDRASGINTLVSHAAGNSLSTSNQAVLPLMPNTPAVPALSADGRYIVYLTMATNIVSGEQDTNGNAGDVFLYDRATGANTLLSRSAASANTTADAESGRVAISSDGAVVAFDSLGGDLPSGVADTNQSWDVFLYEQASGNLSVASRRDPADPELTGNWYSYLSPTPSETVSSDGRYVVFSSRATNLVSGEVEQNGSDEIYLTDRATGTNYLVSHAAGSPTTTMQFGSSDEVLSRDGRFVAFTCNSVVFLYDRTTQAVIPVSHVAGAPNTPLSRAGAPAISGDGRYVAYVSTATGLVDGLVYTNPGASNIYLYDRLTGTNRLVSHQAGSLTTTENAGVDNSDTLAISADGGTIVFGSFATNLVAAQIADPNGADLFAYDVASGGISLISHSWSSPVQGVGFFGPISLSDDGATTVYAGSAHSLIGDPAIRPSGDIILYDRTTGLNELVSHTLSSATLGGNGGSWGGVVSGDGRTVYFDSVAPDLVAGYVSGSTQGDVFAFDRASGLITLISHSTGSATTGGDFGSSDPMTSADGNLVIFRSLATDLLPGFVKSDGAGAYDLFLFDRRSNKTTLLSNTMASQTTSADEQVDSATISADGSTIVFASDAMDLVPGDLNGKSDVFASSGNVTPPPAVIGLTATQGNSGVALSWTGLPGVYGYSVYRTPVAGTTNTALGLVVAGPLTAGGGTVQIAVALAGTSFLDQGVTNGTAYSYQVAAVNTAGQGLLSAKVSGAPAASVVWAVDAGGGVAGGFQADTGFSGGRTFSTTHAIDTTAVTNPAPQALYQTERFGNFTYTATGLTPVASYTVRLHFAEIYWTVTGKRLFNVTINGQQVLTNFDILAVAGASYKAVVQSFAATADSSGRIAIGFLTVKDNAKVSGIEILSSTSVPNPPAPVTSPSAVAGNGQVALTWAASPGATSYNIYRSTTSGGEPATPTYSGVTSTAFTASSLTNGRTYYFQVTAVNAAGESARSLEVSATPQQPPVTPVWTVDAGGGAAESFQADTGFTGGQTYRTSALINTAGVSNPAPRAVYQTERYGNFSYTASGLTAGASYTVRLHFAEIYWTAAGKRVFNVAINGQQVLGNFDIFQDAGGAFKADIRTFTAQADASGEITVTFTSLVNYAKVSGIEIIPQ